MNNYMLRQLIVEKIYSIIKENKNKYSDRFMKSYFYGDIDFNNDDFFKYIIDILQIYTLKLLLIEVFQLYAVNENETVNVDREIISKYLNNDEALSDEYINTIKFGTHYKIIKRRIKQIELIEKSIKRMPEHKNPLETHIDKDNNILPKIDVLSFEYLYDDINIPSFSIGDYFFSDFSSLYFVEKDNVYLYPFKYYHDELINKLRLKNNIFSICLNFRDQIKYSDKNYKRTAKNIFEKYNEYAGYFADVISKIDNKYDKVLAKSQFDMFLFNDFFKCTNSQLFNYLINNIDLQGIFDFSIENNPNTKYLDILNIIKWQKSIFYTNLLKMLMIFNVDLCELSDVLTRVIKYNFKEHNTSINVLNILSIDDVNDLYQVLKLIFDILWGYYTDIGYILKYFIPEKDHNDTDEDYNEILGNFIYIITNDLENIMDKSYENIKFNEKWEKKQLLTISYLFISTIRKKSFYNLHL